MKKHVFVFAIVVLLSGLVTAGLTLVYLRSIVRSQPEPAFHEHADFALFLNGRQFDFSKEEYMSNVPCSITRAGKVPVALAHGETETVRDYVHLHDRIGSVVHVHKKGITWHDFFHSLEMDFSDSLFVDDQGNRYENSDTHSFRFVVNGEEVQSLADREIRDLDQVLITYGRRDRTTDSITIEQARVTNNACLSSYACQHRGVTALESCGAVIPTAADKLLLWLGVKPIDN